MRKEKKKGRVRENRGKQKGQNTRKKIRSRNILTRKVLKTKGARGNEIQGWGGGGGWGCGDSYGKKLRRICEIKAVSGKRGAIAVKKRSPDGGGFPITRK